MQRALFLDGRVKPGHDGNRVTDFIQRWCSGSLEGSDLIDSVLIAGPTASGKSAVAMALARAVGGTIVNADSMQVYRELRILSARPSVEDEAAVPHRLFGHVSVRQPYSVARWLNDARAAIAEIHQAGQVAIVAGGTGLYFKALIEGLATAPTSDPVIRARARERRAELGPEAFHAELVRLDGDAARLNAGDTQRVLRAWEVVTLSRRGLTDWTRDQAKTEAPADMLRIVLDFERKALNARIDARFDAMLNDGALEEVRAFWAPGPDPMLPAAKALGLPHLKRLLDGGAGAENAIEDAKRETRRYAKRQGTWFRNQTRDWMRLDATGGDIGGLCAAILAAMGR